MWWTLAAAAIASITALFIALFVYPKQREIDRRNELRKEQREAYRRFLRQTIDIEIEFSKLDFSKFEHAKTSLEMVDKEKRNFERSLRELLVTASKEVIVAAEKTHENIYATYEKLAKIMTDFANSGANSISSTEMKASIRPILLDAKKSFLKAEKGLIDAMRLEEFGEPLDLEIFSRAEQSSGAE